MQVLKEEIRKRIYDSAIIIFTQKGYLKATIKDIAQTASIPAGLIYSYYENKEAILDEIAGGKLPDQMHFFFEPSEPAHEDCNFFMDKEIPKILELLKTRHKELVVLADKCDGTKYEHTKGTVIDLVSAHMKQHFLKKRPDIAALVDDLFYHIIASGFVDGVFELARHYKSEEWAKNMLYLLARHKQYGSIGM
jgi:AcrR family transcriptional regulator